MKVKELIETLQRYDPEEMVVIDGYEGGFKEVETVEQINLKLNVNEEWYYGKHEEVADGKDFDCNALYIG